MSYPPLNPAVYLAANQAVAGFYSGEFLPSNQAWYAQLADAWAQAMDTAWGAGSYTSLDLLNIGTCSVARFATRGTYPAPPATAAAFADSAALVVALVRATTAQVVAEGIDPNAVGGGGSPTGTAGGNLSGAYPDPAVAEITGNAFGLKPITYSGGTNTSQLAEGSNQMAGKQTTTSAGNQNVVDVNLPANGSHLVEIAFVVRLHGTVGTMAAGRVAGCMYTNNAVATLIGASQQIWFVDPGGILTGVPTIIANVSQLQAGLNVSPIAADTYDWEMLVTVISD